MIPNWKIYPRSQGHSTVYLKNVVKDPTIQVGEYTTYDDYVNDPRDFERNCVLYHYPECNGDTLSIGKFCSIACGAKFIFNAANHALGSLSTYPFPIFFEEWGLPTDCASIAEAWDNHGSITIGNDVWIGYEAVILAGVTIGTVVTFVGLNKSFTNPITQVSQQVNFVVTAAAGAQRVFDLMDQTPEKDEGYVELVNAREEADGNHISRVKPWFTLEM